MGLGGSRALTAENARRIVIGKTSKTDIGNIFGKPRSVVTNRQGDEEHVWQRNYVKFGEWEKVSDYAPSNFSHSDGSVFLSVIYDSNDLVKDFTFFAFDRTGYIYEAVPPEKKPYNIY